MLGYNIESEIMTIDGRIDCVLKTEKYIYVIEFKLDNAKTALQQIKDKKYHHKYLHEPKQIILLGIGFDTEKRAISGFEHEIYRATC